MKFIHIGKHQFNDVSILEKKGEWKARKKTMIDEWIGRFFSMLHSFSCLVGGIQSPRCVSFCLSPFARSCLDTCATTTAADKYSRNTIIMRIDFMIIIVRTPYAFQQHLSLLILYIDKIVNRSHLNWWIVSIYLIHFMHRLMSGVPWIIFTRSRSRERIFKIISAVVMPFFYFVSPSFINCAIILPVQSSYAYHNFILFYFSIG